jgi:hypothetical protein
MRILSLIVPKKERLEVDSKEYGREDKPLPKVPMISQFPKMGIGEKSRKWVFSLEMFSHDIQK